MYKLLIPLETPAEQLIIDFHLTMGAPNLQAIKMISFTK